MNYLIVIDAEIAQLELRIAELRTTRNVLVGLKPEQTLQGPHKVRKVGKPYKTKGGIIRNPGAAGRAREFIIEFLQGQSMPIKASLISQMLNTHNIKDTTMWNVLKSLRDEGVVKWDTETRLYSIVPMMQHGKAVAS